MSFLQRISATTITSMVFLFLPVAATAGADPFYESLLREGQLSYERGDLEAAIIELELACFGLLEEPNRLAAGLTYLGVVEGKSGRTEDFEETFRRILELEERFGAYSASRVDTEVRTDFESFAKVLAPRGYLVSTPAFAHLAVEPEPPVSKKEKKRRRKANETEVAAEGTAPAEEGNQGVTISTSDVEALDTRPLAVAEPTVTEIPAADPEPESEEFASDVEVVTLEDEFDEEAFDRATSLLADARSRDDLKQAMAIARPLADEFPERQKAQHLVARIAYMGSGWEDCIHYYERGGESSDPEIVFYAAVGYFELGRPDEAKAQLEIALPNLTRTDYVNSYIEKILGNQGLR